MAMRLQNKRFIKFILIIALFLLGGSVVYNGLYVYAYYRSDLYRTAGGTEGPQSYTDTQSFRTLYLSYTDDLINMLHNKEPENTAARPLFSKLSITQAEKIMEYFTSYLFPNYLQDIQLDQEEVDYQVDEYRSLLSQDLEYALTALFESYASQYMLMDRLDFDEFRTAMAEEINRILTDAAPSGLDSGTVGERLLDFDAYSYADDFVEWYNVLEETDPEAFYFGTQDIWIHENNKNYAYFIQDGTTGRTYYNQPMYQYIKEVFGLEEGYPLTLDYLTQYCADTMDIPHKFLHYSKRSENVLFNLNLFLTDGSSMYQNDILRQKLGTLQHDYQIYTFYIHETEPSEYAFADIEAASRFLNSRYEAAVMPCIAASVIFVLLFLLLCFLSLHPKSEPETVGWYDKIPLECLLASALMVLLVVFSFIENYAYRLDLSRYTYDGISGTGGIGQIFAGFSMMLLLLFAGAYLLLLPVCLLTLRRMRNHTLYRSLLSVQILLETLRILRRLGRACARRIRNQCLRLKKACKGFFLYRSTTTQILIVLLLFFLYESVFVVLTLLHVYAGRSGLAGLLPMAFGFLMLLYIMIRLGSDYNHMLHAAEKISTGDIDSSIDTDALLMPMKKLAQQLNSIGTGLTAAVEDKIKSERFKTELITNVSHDIKTPLTSIITYVDLLGKEELGNTKAYEYILILKEKSWRLKTLIDDLVEASKASTGNIALSFEKIDFGELLKQSCGEFKDRFEDRKLDLILSLPDKPVMISADGRSTYRIIDNLFSNVTKYALSGTRVYVELKIQNMYAALHIKNISTEQLNVSAEELMERFVRGDASRNTDGSGLGLSIAGSLTNLLNGFFHITVDGDLFKASVELPLYLEYLDPGASYTVEIP